MRRRASPARPDPRALWQVDQGKRCGCGGTDDMCPCQNVCPWPPARTPDWKARAEAAERSLQEAKGVIERAAEDLNEIALGRPGGPITRTDAPKWLERAERIAMTGREAVYTFLHRCGPEPAKPEVSENG